MAVAIEDASGYSGFADEYFAPGSEAEVAGILSEANARRIPVTIGGAGTGITGGRVPSGGWMLSLEKLNRIEVDRGRAIAGAGALLRDLHAAAATTRQLYPPDPTETGASLGGTISTNASGSRSFRFGDTRRHVRRLRVALIDGSIMDVRRGDPIDFEVPSLPMPRTTKHTAGYRLRPGMDWVDLFVGSDGTLGVVMEAEVGLVPLPDELLSGVVFFPSDETTLDAVEAWRQEFPPRMLEYIDRPSLQLLRTRYREIPEKAAAALLIEDQTDALDRWDARLETSGALAEDSWFGTSASDRERFRKFRHSLPETINDTVRRRGFWKINSDYAVPFERNRDMLAHYREVLERDFPGHYVIFGHIGDAHVHVNILPESREEFERGNQAMVDLARHAVSLGGTVSAEHGLGKRKAYLLPLEYSPGQIDAMMQVKRRLDPNWLLGRGNLFPVPEEFR